MTSTAFEDLDHEWNVRQDQLMALTPAQRVAAMRAGHLTYRDLAHWSAARPDEVPRVSTGQGGPGEFEWIAAFIPEMAEATDTTSAPLQLDDAALERGAQIRAQARQQQSQAQRAGS
jgi:hypothetical protein